MSYRLGVDVGGTFTDLLLVNEKSGQTWKAKVSSTPADQSIGVLHGIERVCGLAGIQPSDIRDVMHGTTVATNTVLTATGARVSSASSSHAPNSIFRPLNASASFTCSDSARTVNL